MGSYDGLFLVGMKLVGNLINRKTNKDKNARNINLGTMKDDLEKSVHDANDFVNETKAKAEKIQKEEMVHKTTDELKNIVEDSGTPATIYAANLELKSRGQFN